MPKFSPKSFTELSTCHIDLQVVFFEVIKTYDCSVLEGYRSEEKQNTAYIHGRTKVQWPSSRHNVFPSMAVDVAPYPVDFSEAGKNLMRYYFFAGYVLRAAEDLKLSGKISHGLRWGGCWDGDFNFNHQKFDDLVHYELV